MKADRTVQHDGCVLAGDWVLTDVELGFVEENPAPGIAVVTIESGRENAA